MLSAAQKMERRHTLYARLLTIDEDLKAAFAAEPSNRATATARDLLNHRALVCESLVAAGFFPPDITSDLDGEVEVG